MGVCVQLHSCKTGRVTPAAQMLQILLAKAVGHGATWKLRCASVCVACFYQAVVTNVQFCFALSLAFLVQLLGADSQGAAWNFCAPAVDYDSMRKEAATIFMDKRAEVQQLVAKLHKTQRAAEKALDA